MGVYGMDRLQDWNYLEIDDLSNFVRGVAETIGFEATKILMQTLPLEGIYISTTADLLNPQVAMVLDSEAISNLTKFYGGDTLILSKTKALDKARHRKMLLNAQQQMKHFSSKTKYYAKVAVEEGLSMVRVRQLLSQH
jgi:hypothetical protein